MITRNTSLRVGRLATRREGQALPGEQGAEEVLADQITDHWMPYHRDLPAAHARASCGFPGQACAVPGRLRTRALPGPIFSRRALGPASAIGL